MGLFDVIFKPRQVIKAAHDAKAYFKTLTAYQPVFRTWRGAIYESELVRSAIDARARHISKLKIEIIGSAKPSLQAKLRLGPNQWQTWSQFLYRVSTILDNDNTCFIVPIQNDDLEVTGYFPVISESCSLVEYKNEPYLRYKFRNGQIAAVELRKCALLTKFQYRDDFFGSSNAALDETMQLITIQNQGVQEAIKNSAKHEDLVNERKRFSEENFSQEAEGGGLLLFPNTYSEIQRLESKPFTIDNDQMEFIRSNVYNYFGVNEDILQNKAYGDAWSAFYEGAVETFAIQFSETMTAAMFTERERAGGAMLMATANRLQYLSNKDKLEVSAQMADRGIMSRNEIREIWNLPPIPGGDRPTIRGEYYLINDDGTIERNETEDANDE